ncbi:predicted protein [Postia placenta Mad-698-R]|nr:predicted protein [Postia placenta Mad-698-R]
MTNRETLNSPKHITSKDPLAHPEIDPHVFEEQYDLQTLVELVKFCRTLAMTEPLKDILGDEIWPAANTETDEQIEDQLRNVVSTSYHTVGSCSMLPLEDGGVVDSRLKVYHTTGVRVVDLSIVPLHIGSHTQAMAYAIGEQGPVKLLNQSGLHTMETFLSLHPTNIISVVAYAHNDISEGELYDQISTFVLTGQEATTTTLGFTIWQLAHHPEVQERLYEEIEAYPHEPPHDDFVSRLPYLDAILRETRLSFKTGVLVVPIIAIQRQDAIWKDADSFMPERWLGSLPPQEQLHAGWSHMSAFSEGPRNCIGAKFAIFQYKVILSGLISRFRFEPVSGELTSKIASSLQPWIVGMEDKGPQIPVVAHLR